MTESPTERDPVFLTAYRHPRESGGPRAVVAPLPVLDSRVRGNDEVGRGLFEIFGFTFVQTLGGVSRHTAADGGPGACLFFFCRNRWSKGGIEVGDGPGTRKAPGPMAGCGGRAALRSGR